MAQSKHTGRTYPLLAKSGLVAAFLAGAGAAMVAQNTHADGLVRCWGINTYGQCYTPADLGPCSSVAGGYTHTIAVRSDGVVRCWGYNNHGQCNTPSDLGACSSVAGGGAHTIALRIDGGVRCWGLNFYGQCNTPADLGPCSSVAGGFIHTIALRSDGIVRCWGYNGLGQCNTPADLGACSSIAGGEYHTIALRTDGGVRCWGINNYGQCYTPADLGPCSSVAGGRFHTVALRIDGGVGDACELVYGQCDTPADLGPCSSVAGGYAHTIAIAGPPPLDTDGDGRPDSTDNCPTIANPTQADCNNNGVGDACELAAGAPDYNQDTIPDTCQCIADLFVDHQVNGADLGALLAFWGPVSPSLPSADINRDGSVDGADLGYLLYAWGPCPCAGTCVTVPSWATLVEADPDPAVVIDVTLRTAITASGLAWRVRDTATQMEMLLVPPGTFVMGEAGLFEPVHSVTLTQAFYVGRYEVTQSQWVARMGSNPSTFQGASYPNAANRPVETVSWDAIQSFLSATAMRLPSEAEWEYACRAGTTTAFHSSMPGYPNGTNDASLAWRIAWYGTEYGGDSGERTNVVGGKAANALGLHDMSGNVWESVNDWYGGYSSGAQTNPLGPVSGNYRVLRGGSWSDIRDLVRSSYRGYDAPGSAGSRRGFRVARNP